MPIERLDVRLSREMGISRSQVERLIGVGMATVNGKAETKPGRKVGEGDQVALTVPPPKEMAALPEDLPLAILYEDEHIALVDKPCGMVVHPGPGNEEGTLVNALLHHLQGLSGIGGILRPGIVHRLDKDTSGLLLIAKNDRAHVALSEALKARQVKKTYLAVCLGHLKEESGTINGPIGRHPGDRKRMAILPNGREALTEYRVLQALRGATYAEVSLITGRTHQIRVHFKSLGHPLLGDVIYGGKQPGFSAKRLMLHAFRIGFIHPITGEAMAFEAPPPKDFQREIKKILP